MKLKILESIIHDGKVHAEGAVVDLARKAAEKLIEAEFAREHTDPPPAEAPNPKPQAPTG